MTVSTKSSMWPLQRRQTWCPSATAWWLVRAGSQILLFCLRLARVLPIWPLVKKVLLTFPGRGTSSQGVILKASDRDLYPNLLFFQTGMREEEDPDRAALQLASETAWCVEFLDKLLDGGKLSEKRSKEVRKARKLLKAEGTPLPQRPLRIP